MRTIVALDNIGSNIEGLKEITQKTCSLVAGYKLGWPNFIGANPRDILNAVKASCQGKMIIADLKLADIFYTMKRVLDMFPEGLHSVIAHALIGTNGALLELKDYLEKRGINLILVASMSHPGSRDVIDKCYEDTLEIIKLIEPWGIVAPATRPRIITRLRKELGRDIVILSPGIGAQGARPGDALRAGADYEIIGRMITTSPDPAGILKEIVEEQATAVNSVKNE